MYCLNSCQVIKTSFSQLLEGSYVKVGSNWHCSAWDILEMDGEFIYDGIFGGLKFWFDEFFGNL